MKTHAEAVARLMGKASKPRRHTEVSILLRGETMEIERGQSLVMPIRAVSVSNEREHWASKARRTKAHRARAWLLCRSLLRKPALLFPIEVTLVRIAPRGLDGDNLQGSLKATRDGIADWLGVDDRDPSVTWLYAQERGEPKTYGVRVEIRRLP